LVKVPEFPEKEWSEFPEPAPACALFYCVDCGHIVGSGNPWVSIVRVENPVQVEEMEHAG
jgi:hypothetical protein